jgi:hypothetical protein
MKKIFIAFTIGAPLISISLLAKTRHCNLLAKRLHQSIFRIRGTQINAANTIES